MDYKIRLYANDTAYDLNDVDSILHININYDKFAAIEVSYEKYGVIKSFQVMFKFPQDDKFKFETNIFSDEMSKPLNDLIDINRYLTKDIENFNKLKSKE